MKSKEASQALKNFCGNVATLRSYYRLSEESMAEILEISVECYKQVEQGVVSSEVTTEALLHIYERFSISPTKFLGTVLKIEDGALQE
ncbi:hypothetical protein [Neglectibacter caecimuris]|uniref:hypothetical protein n=1 Tax=Neglectibacter caecimuris TaxID=3093658 RepID=UPI002AC8FDC5|nr:hypothetical protein [Neglectibacter sp. M00184]